MVPQAPVASASPPGYKYGQLSAPSSSCAHKGHYSTMASVAFWPIDKKNKIDADATVGKETLEPHFKNLQAPFFTINSGDCTYYQVS